MIDSDASFRARELAFAVWERMKDREMRWLIETGRMPPQSSGRYAVEAHRWQIYPTYDLETAASVMGVDGETLYAAALGGDIEHVSVYGMILFPFSGLAAFGAKCSPPLEMPAGGGWEELPADEWWRLHWERARRLRDSFRGEPQLLEMVEKAIERDENLYVGRAAPTEG